jgi:hypothetical protein
MTPTELATERPGPSRTNGKANGTESSLTDQAVLSGAGLLTETIGRTRDNAGTLIDVLDQMVLGTFDLIEELNSLSAQVLPQLAAKQTELARTSYATVTSALRRVIGEV